MQQCAEERGLLGKLCPGEKKLNGKTFYLDGVKKRSTALLLETISLLGGRVESFLHKDVSFVVTESQESLKEQKCSDFKGEAKGTNEGTQRPTKQWESVLSNDRHRLVTPRPVACGSRGKALLEKAIRNNERLKVSSVLANARSWGVKILYVNDVLLYLKRLTRESLSIKHKKPEKTYNKQQGSHVVKATALRSPYLKIEDSSRKHKPLHMQSMTFPSLWYSGRFSPFESAPPRFEKRTEHEENITREKNKIDSSAQNKCETPISCNPSLWRPRKKDLSYCECCHQHFANLEEHLQSDQHRTFVLDPSNYSVVDQLVLDMLPEFNPYPSQQSEEILNKPPTPLSIQDFCELQPLSDVETELAVQALQKQGSSFTAHISCPNRGLLSSGPDSLSRGVRLPIPNPVTPPTDIQSLPNECHFSDIQPHCSSPAMPVLDVEPQALNSACQLPDNRLSPFPETPCTSCDPYPLAPVLSPQVPYSSYIVEPHSSYSDPPILSPQKYTEEELVEGVLSQMHMAESSTESFLPEKVPVSTPPLPFIHVVNAEELNQEDPLVFSGIVCSSNCLDCDKCALSRSRSFSHQSTTALNSKKRCHAASPENSRSKRRRLTVEFGYSYRWTEKGHISAKPDILPKPEDSLSDQLVSCLNPVVSTASNMSTVETLVSKQTFSTFCVPAVQNFIRAPQISSLCHDGTCVADQPSWPQSSTAKSFDCLLQFPSNKCGFSSQDSQCSLSHSTSVCIESTLIPDLATLSPSSSDSDWDCNLLSCMGPISTTPLSQTEQSCELDKDLLHRPCTWMHNTSYESRLHTVLEPSAPAASLCGEDMDPSAFSRTVVQIVEVQH